MNPMNTLYGPNYPVSLHLGLKRVFRRLYRQALGSWRIGCNRFRDRGGSARIWVNRPTGPVFFNAREQRWSGCQPQGIPWLASDQRRLDRIDRMNELRGGAAWERRMSWPMGWEHYRLAALRKPRRYG